MPNMNTGPCSSHYWGLSATDLMLIQSYRQGERLGTEGQTDLKQYAPNHSIWGIQQTYAHKTDKVINTSS